MMSNFSLGLILDPVKPNDGSFFSGVVIFDSSLYLAD